MHQSEAVNKRRRYARVYTRRQTNMKAMHHVVQAAASIRGAVYT